MTITHVKRRIRGIFRRRKEQYVRNLWDVPAHVRLGQRNDPYSLCFERRGVKGDTQVIPKELVGSDIYTRNLGLVFEQISARKAAKIDYESQPLCRRSPGCSPDGFPFYAPQDKEWTDNVSDAPPDAHFGPF